MAESVVTATVVWHASTAATQGGAGEKGSILTPSPFHKNQIKHKQYMNAFNVWIIVFLFAIL